MKAVILAGGLGSRLSEESHLKPNGGNWRETYSVAHYNNLFGIWN